MNPRLSLYFSEETHEKFKEIKSYLKESSALQKQYRNNSATLVTLIEVFYKLFACLFSWKKSSRLCSKVMHCSNSKQ